jgi:hypothetical protein
LQDLVLSVFRQEFSPSVIVSGLGILILLLAGAIIQNNRRAVSSFHHDEMELSSRINTLASALSLLILIPRPLKKRYSKYTS